MSSVREFAKSEFLGGYWPHQQHCEQDRKHYWGDAEPLLFTTHSKAFKNQRFIWDHSIRGFIPWLVWPLVLGQNLMAVGTFGERDNL